MISCTRKFLILLLLVVFFFESQAKENNFRFDNSELKQRKLSIYFGWNRGFFTNSNIHFKGNDFDFTLNRVSASDRQSEFKVKTYFGIKKFTIPQTNYGLRYSISEKSNFTFNVDHMKYVMDQGQTATIDGSISENYPEYSGIYEGDKIILSEDFLRFEHTDGLNYINFGYERILKKTQLLKKTSLSFLLGINGGFLLPKTNSTFLGKSRYDDFHLSGYGIGADARLQWDLTEWFFLSFQTKSGYINMSDIRISQLDSDRASQSFGFLQVNGTFGFKIKI